MNAFIAAVIAAVALGLAAMFVLTNNQELVYQEFATSGARVSEPGHNLVGKAWNGDPNVHDTSESVHGEAESPPPQKGAPAQPKRS